MNADIAILILLAVVLLWFFVMRPARRRQNDQLEMQDNLRIGDEIVTAGGLYGTIERLDEEELHVEIAEGVVVRVARRAVAGLITEESKTEAAERLTQG